MALNSYNWKTMYAKHISTIDHKQKTMLGISNNVVRVDLW